jgi:tRNA pseudouridine38-40 synthase
MSNYAGLVEYDGANFAGWAAQPDRRTVEATLTDALGTVLRQPVKLAVAGRTDAGVHASGQTVSFTARTDIASSTIAYKTTAVLPEDVALRRCAAVPDDFDARRDARARSYEYRVVNDPIRAPLLRDRALYVARPLDPELLRECAVLLRGTHDFRAFTPSRTYHVRFERVVFESRWERRGALLVFHITADSFLYGMVRALVGTMLEVALGKRDLDSFRYLISGGERGEAGPSVTPRGLTLTGVRYDRPLPWSH